MRALTQRSLGGPEVLEIAEAPVPRVGAGEVLVRVKAAALNPGEKHIRSGRVTAIGEYGPRSLPTLKPGGLLIAAALDPGLDAADVEARGLRLARPLVGPAAATLEKIAELVVAGRLRVLVERTFPLEEAAAAAALSEGGRVTGKLVLVL